MADIPDLDDVIARYTAGSFTDSTLLTEVGLVSLSVFRIVAALCPDPGTEVNVEGVAGIRTILELKQWLGRLLGDPVGGTV